MTDKIEEIRKALEAGEPHCLKCGAPRSAHPYRHPFQPSHTTALETLAPDMARIVLAAEELADAYAAFDGALNIKGESLWSRRKRTIEALAAYRKAVEGGE